MTSIILAILIGLAFGFSLHRVGATNPNYIIGMLRLNRLHLMKTIMFAVGFSSLLLFAGLMLGIIDPGHLGVKTAYNGVFIGGILLGLGFAIAGYCPGTSLAAMATGRKDAFFFVIGGLLGAGAYMMSYQSIATTGLLDKILGGKATLGKITNTAYPAVFDGVSGELIGIGAAIVLIAIAFLLPNGISTRKNPTVGSDQKAI